MASNFGDQDFRRDIGLIFSAYRNLACSVDRYLRKHRLGRLHYQLMLIIRRHPDEALSHYVSSLKLTKTSMSRLVRDLLAQSFVEERVGMRDRRARFLVLTEKGAALEEEITHAHCKHLEQLYGTARPVVRQSFRKIMLSLLDKPTAPVNQQTPILSAAGLDPKAAPTPRAVPPAGELGTLVAAFHGERRIAKKDLPRPKPRRGAEFREETKTPMRGTAGQAVSRTKQNRCRSRQARGESSS